MLEIKSTESQFEIINAQRETGIQTHDKLESHAPKWPWVCRRIYGQRPDSFYVLPDEAPPCVADVALVRVERVGHHTRLDTSSGGRLRIYPGDCIVAVFGNRYATDVYEGRVRNLSPLHLLTSSGLVGTVTSRHRNVCRPTTLSFLGYLVNGPGLRVNTKELFFRPVAGGERPTLILVVGTGMNTGKTTVTRKLLRGLITRGVKAAGCKLTGTASPRDLREYDSTGPIHSMDFSEFGLPSTFGASADELLQLLHSMLDVCSRKGADVAVMEIADGFLQRETQILLQSDVVRRLTSGVVLSAACSGSALGATQFLEEAGFKIWAVSGLVTIRLCFVREYRRRSSVTVATSHAGPERLAEAVLKHLDQNTRQVREAEAS